MKALGGAALRRGRSRSRAADARAPRLRLHGGAAALAAEQAVELRVSLTHSHELAAAIVVADPLGSRQ